MSGNSEVFLVYPRNRKFLSGDEAFERVTDQYSSIALFSAIVCIACIGGIFLISAIGDLAGIACIVGLVAPFAFVIALMFALTHRRLAAGRFVDARIVDSKGYFLMTKGGDVFWLKLTYTFDSPSGTHIERTVKVQRQDLRKDPPGAFMAFGTGVRQWIAGRNPQELTPPPGTPLKVRYVNDRFFRVM